MKAPLLLLAAALAIQAEPAAARSPTPPTCPAAQLPVVSLSDKAAVWFVDGFASQDEINDIAREAFPKMVSWREIESRGREASLLRALSSLRQSRRRMRPHTYRDLLSLAAAHS